MLIHTGISELIAYMVADINLLLILVSKYFVKNKLNALPTFIDKIVYSNKKSFIH